MSLKKTIDHEITEFEFEFCLDSDGFIKNKDYKMSNFQFPAKEEPKTGEEYYTDYDSEFEEDTMDVEDIPEDADFEWCWDEEGRLRIDEIEKEERISVVGEEEQALPEQVMMMMMMMMMMTTIMMMMSRWWPESLWRRARRRV